MDFELLNKITSEIEPQTLVECYNVLQKTLQALEHTLRNFGTFRWLMISQMILPDDFIQVFQDKVEWSYISDNYPLDEKFLKTFQDRLGWEKVSKNQNLTKAFIREFQEKVDWENIS